VSALDRKLLRDVLELKGQLVTIALVVACGISSYVTMRTAYRSLLHSREHYYAESRFADAFVSLERAPNAARRQLERIDGVARVETRVMENVLVPVSGLPRPASGIVISRDERSGVAALNDVYLVRGRLLDPTRRNEVLVLEGFATAHGLEPGQRVSAVINGTLKELDVVGVVMSPEYIMALAPGQLTYDPSQVAVLWMNEEVLQAAFRMEGAFNGAAFELEPDANVRAVLEAIDDVVHPYGGFGAVAREKQASHFMLNGELEQLRTMADFVPYLFLFVAALLVNVVLSRLVQLQRGQIATLKAVGYRDLSVGLYYLKLVSLVMLTGAVLGVALGAWLGSELTGLYTDEFFRFPSPRYVLELEVVLFACGVSLGAAAVGAWVAVKQVVALPPAEAMRPPAPATYRRWALERLGILRFIGPSMKMVWRELSRRPLRLALSALGISLAVGILVVARSMYDAMDYLIDVQFHRSMREDLNLVFVKPLPERSIRELAHVPGVLYAEGLRSVPVRFRAGHRFRDSTVLGYPDERRLRLLLDEHAEPVNLPGSGVLLTTKLAEVLDLRSGDEVEVELREGEWNTRRVRVAGLVSEPFGMQGHMSEKALARLAGGTGAVNTALLCVDAARRSEVVERLGELPWVLGVSSPREFRDQFDEQSGAIMGTFTLILTLFAGVIAVGVIYNNARVALSQRNRDLASLRVLGFTRREIAAILFGEQAVQVAIAVPVGLVVGYFMTRAMMSNVDPETYRLPVIISERTYAFAVAVTLASALVSALLLRRKVHRIDLVGVLKTRE
jgi:putative ABC transport system permease protein